MKKYEITYEKINYNDKNTRQFVVNLLYKLKKLSQIDISKSKIFIEAFQTEEEGCILYLNIVSEKTINHILNTETKNPLIIQFKDMQSLRQMCKNPPFKKYINTIFKSELYYKNNNFILIIYSYYKHAKKLSACLFEHGTHIGFGELNKKLIEEHCNLVINNNAIEKILKNSTN